MLYSYSFQNKKRDLSDVLSTIIKDEPRFISLFRPSDTATQQKHEWLQDQISGRSITASEVSNLACTVSEADAAKVMVGSLLTVKGDSALFRVASISGTTVTVALVAANGSTKTTPANGDVLNIVSTPMPEGTNNGDGEQSYKQSGTNFNYTQIFRKDIILSGSALAINVYGSVDNQMNRQTAFALSELARDLNRVALFGRQVQPVAGVKGEAGGLYCFGTQQGGLLIDANATMFDSFVVNDGAQAVLGEGAEPSLILCSPGQARVLSNEYKDRLQIVRSDDRRGAYVAVIVNEVNGSAMTIMAEPDMPDTDAWVLDPSGFGLSPLKGRSIADEDATPKGFDGIKRMALGELTFVFKNPLQRLCRIKNLKTSASGIAAYKAGIAKKVDAEVTNTAVPVVGSLGAVSVAAESDLAGLETAGSIVIIGTGWTEGTKIVTAVAGEFYGFNGTAWVKLG